MTEVGVIVGASRGIGQKLTERLAAAYPTLHIIAVSSCITTSLAAAVYAEKYPNITLFDADMNTTEGVNSLINHIEGKIKFLVYNSATPGPIIHENPTPEDFDRTMNINTRAVFFLGRGVADKFAENSKFLIVNAALHKAYMIPFPFYSISKAALFMVYQVLKKEVTTTAVGSALPGIVKTDISDTVGAKMNVHLPFKFLDPDMSAKFFAYLLSDRVSSEEFSSAEWDIYTPEHQDQWLEEGDEAPSFPQHK